ERVKKRHWLRWILLGVFVVSVVLAIDLAWAGSRAIDAFTQARDGLSAGGTALQSGNVPEAHNEFGAASSAGHEAVDALGQPVAAVAAWRHWLLADTPHSACE